MRQQSRAYFTNIAIIVPEILENIKNVSVSLAVTLLLIAGQKGVQAKIIKLQGPEAAYGLISEKILRQQIGFLSDSICGGRGTGTRGGSEAAFWLLRSFKQLGLEPLGETYIHHFHTSTGLTGRNIIGCIPGSRKGFKDKYILLAAHYDGLGVLGGKMYPGADSNASGVVAMLSVAKMLKSLNKYGRAYESNIIIAALDGKEENLSGSTALWSLIEEGGLKNPESGEAILSSQISFMVNIDQIGSSLSPLKSGREDYIIVLGCESGFSESLMSSVNNQYGIGLDLAFDYYGSADFTRLFYRKVSDQKVFIENGKPALMFTSGITMNNNKTTDRPETLNMEVLKKRIYLIFHWLEKMI